MTTEPSSLPRNAHLRPTTRMQRTSTAWEIASLWIGLLFGLPSYYIAGTLVEKGMTWWQGIAVIILAKAILLFPLLLTSEPGARYGIPFPVLARAAFGVRGAHIPAILRALVSCGWFGIETWFGGQVICLLLPSSLTDSSLAQPLPWLATSPLELSCFATFWLLQLALLWKGMRGIQELEKYSAPVLVLLASLLFAWAATKAGGLGPMLSKPSTLTPSQFFILLLPSLTANVGSWAPMALSIPDFTRYTRCQRDQVLGQVGLPLFAGTFAFVGLAVTSSTESILGRIIPNPIDLVSAIGGPLVLGLAVPGLSLAIVTTNIPANIVAPANAFVSLNPSVFTFRRGAVATAVVGAVVFQPWRILKSPDSFMYTWLVGYSAVVGPVSGVLLADYYLLRSMVLNVGDLYSIDKEGEYYYWKGFNLVAVATLVASWAPIVPGFLHKLGFVESLPRVFVVVYDVGWFFGFSVSGVVYVVLSVCVGRYRMKGKQVCGKSLRE